MNFKNYNINESIFTKKQKRKIEKTSFGIYQKKTNGDAWYGFNKSHCKGDSKIIYGVAVQL
ncbi:hypothetical protein Y10_18060 [Neptunitalea sp. Y10]|uniref:Uncharacterized protein n=1 Tax=Neptunitalea lumnitzerae TaxID=2965509 RepID=A0ABQ5MJ63_9FLAO|nr:hypothetical protein Y10_18060 [Neptunitalea sp. Y10]